MRIVAVGFWILIFTVAFLITQSASAQQNPSSAGRAASKESQEQKKPAFACSLTSLSASERERHKMLREELRAKTNGVRELPDGYEISLPDDNSVIKTLAEWVTFERLCCPFFTFQIEVKGAGSPLLLRLSGPQGVKQFLQSEFALK